MKNKTSNSSPGSTSVSHSPSQLPGPPSHWWTGPIPLPGQCPGVDLEGHIHSLPQLRLDYCSRQQILDYFNNSWAITEVLFSALQGEKAFTTPAPHQLRHPLLFYYGHPAVLYVNKLRVAGLLNAPVDSFFEQLFEVGVDEMSWDDMSKNEMQWPTLARVTEYRRKVYEMIRDLIVEHPAFDESRVPFLPHTQAWALVMAFEHERIHIETSTVLMRELPVELLRKPAQWPKLGLPQERLTARAQNDFVVVPEGVVYLGKAREIPTFGWDNEYGSETQKVPSFSAQQSLISNGEFLEFVQAGGYREMKHWSSEGWRWLQFRNTKYPTFWVPDGPTGLHEYRIRLIFEVVDWQPLLPVVVNYHEAKAYCAWRSECEQSPVPYELLSEAQHHRLRLVSDQGDVPSGNLGLQWGCETSVTAGTLDWHDVFGNVWQWCEDEFHPFAGFAVHPYYEDFSTPCFDGKHQMILGGSFVSTGDEASAYARFHFRAHFFQHAGFRMVKQQAGAAKTSFHFKDRLQNSSDYESSELLSQYLLLHYGDPRITAPESLQSLQVTDFPKRCGEVVIKHARQQNVLLNRALDIGCATGGAVFELSSAFESVIGIDLSESFIKAAQTLKEGRELSYRFKVEGDLYEPGTAKIPATARPECTQFRQADACSLPAEYVGFDAVLLANLLCRLPSPKSCLSRMLGPRSLVAKGGLLVLVSPYSWLDEHTEKSAWLGGYLDGETPVRSESALKDFLQLEFELLTSEQMPLVIREHSRKYQYIVSHLMVWKKR